MMAWHWATSVVLDVDDVAVVTALRVLGCGVGSRAWLGRPSACLSAIEAACFDANAFLLSRRASSPARRLCPPTLGEKGGAFGQNGQYGQRFFLGRVREGTRGSWNREERCEVGGCGRRGEIVIAGAAMSRREASERFRGACGGFPRTSGSTQGCCGSRPCLVRWLPEDEWVDPRHRGTASLTRGIASPERGGQPTAPWGRVPTRVVGFPRTSGSTHCTLGPSPWRVGSRPHLVRVDLLHPGTASLTRGISSPARGGRPTAPWDRVPGSWDRVPSVWGSTYCTSGPPPGPVGSRPELVGVDLLHLGTASQARGGACPRSRDEPPATRGT